MVPPTVTQTVDESTASRREDAYARLEACLAEVRALERQPPPPPDKRWAVRYRSLSEARNGEVTAYWRRHGLMAGLNVVLAIAALALLADGRVATVTVGGFAVLALGVDLAWMTAARGAARRLAYYDARLDALDSEAPGGEESLSPPPETARPAAAAGAWLLVAVFSVFWTVAALACLFARGLVTVAAR